MAIKPIPILTVDLKTNGGKFSFTKLEEVEQWLDEITSYFSWISNISNNHPNIRNIEGDFQHRTQQLRQDLNNARANPNNINPYLENFKNKVEQMFLSGQLLHQKSIKAKYIKELSKENPVVAAHAYGYFIKALGSSSQFSQESFEGFFRAHLFDVSKDDYASLNSAYDDKLSEFNTLINEHKTEIAEIQNRAETLVSNFIEASNFSLNGHKLQHDKQFEAAATELKNIAESYDQKMAMQASITYWEEKKQHHETVANRLIVMGLFFLVIGLLITTLVCGNLLDFELVKTNEQGAFMMFASFPLWKITLSALCISIFVWILRIFVRLILSNLHLTTDAGERVVMAKTYIAMLRDGSAPLDEDRKLILASLFRPNATGIISDDGMPFNLDKMQRMSTGN